MTSLEFDLLDDSGYTEAMSNLEPVESVQKPDNKLQCPQLEFSDEDQYDEISINLEKNNNVSKMEENDEPQHVLKTIIKNDIEFISGELSLADIKKDSNFVSSENEFFSTCPIMFLPREVILKIFCYIPQQQLCCCIARVCKQWYDYAFDASLWKTINLCNYIDIPSVNLCRIIAKATNLKKLILQGRQNISESEVTVFTEYTPHLKYLDLGFCHSVNEAILGIIAENCQFLEHINLEGITGFQTGGVQNISKCKHLKSINLSHCSIDNEDLFHLARNLETITCINIDGISWITDEPVIFLLQRHHETLQELALDGAELSDDCYKAIATCTKLTSLESSFCELLSDESLHYIQNLRNLKKLRLRKGTEFSTGGLLMLMSSPAVRQLISLDLSECTGFGDSCVIEMAKSCGKTLKYLSLCWCWYITDNGASAIVDHCRNLTVLNLQGLKQMVGECFARIPSDLPHLRLLDLVHCNMIEDELIESVVRQKRDLTAINYYGQELQYGTGDTVDV